MKHTILAALITLFLTACATSTYSVGKPFPSEKVSEIQKGVTTTSELKSLLGEPFTKTVLSATQEKWIYSHTSGSAKATLGSVSSTGSQKTLDVLIEDNVVLNYTFTEGPVSGYTTQ